MPDISLLNPIIVPADAVLALLPTGNFSTAPRWNAAEPLGAPVTISYFFNDGPPDYDESANGYTNGSAVAWSDAQRNTVLDVFTGYSSVANISFVAATDQASSDLNFYLSSTLTTSGFAYYPPVGNIFFSSDSFPSDGSNLYLAYHEIGHALGLAHPYEGGVKPTIESFGLEGSRLFSVVDQRLTEKPYYLYVDGNSGGYDLIFNPEGPSILDIAALQGLYGSNTSTASGDDTYQFDVNPNFYRTIWDAGGHDTIDTSNQTNPSLISLVEGTFSTIGYRDPFAGFPSWLTTWAVNIGLSEDNLNDGANSLGIAFGTVIEDAIGGLAGDILIGNSVSNFLSGGEGNDTLQGGDGDDNLAGGPGSDTFQLLSRLFGTDSFSDFVSAGDVIELGRSGFSTDLAIGNLQPLTLASGPSATADYVQFVYNQATGELLFDSDGTGSEEAILIALLTPGTNLLASHIRLIEGEEDLLVDHGPTFTQGEINAIPVTDFMRKIKDYDGNNFGAVENWFKQGDVDIQNDGDTESVYTNRALGRWATLGPDGFSIIDFDNHGAGGDTRVVGIYIDPLVVSGEVVQGSDFDSQRRFQNDLLIDNLRLLGGDDYDGDSFQELYFKTVDGTAYLRAIMHADGNIQYANYQNEQQMTDYLIGQGFGEEYWGNWLI